MLPIDSSQINIQSGEGKEKTDKNVKNEIDQEEYEEIER